MGRGWVLWPVWPSVVPTVSLLHAQRVCGPYNGHRRRSWRSWEQLRFRPDDGHERRGKSPIDRVVLVAECR
jgi:hypothetical protein